MDPHARKKFAFINKGLIAVAVPILGTIQLASAQETTLQSKKVEFHDFAALNFGPNRAPANTVGLSYGAEVAVGITRYLAATGEFTVNLLGSVPDYGTGGTEHASVREAMGGFRFSPFRLRRVAVYTEASFGLARSQVSESYLGSAFGAAQNKFGFAPGSGVEFLIKRRWGLFGDFHAVKALGVDPYYRAAGGVFYRL